MTYLLEEQVKNAELDLLDYKESLERAEKDLIDARFWRDKVSNWVTKAEAELETLKKEVELEANRIGQNVN